MNQLAADAAQIVRDNQRNILHRTGALFILLFAASPFAAAALVAIAVLAYQIKEQGRMCMEDSHKSAEERMAIAERHEKQLNALEDRREMREDRHAERMQAALKELMRSVDRQTEMVSGKYSSQPKGTQKSEDKAEKTP